MSHRNLLVTSALPYANGPIHIGHLVETLQTDMWVRFQKGRGHSCLYFCADDTHGTPIMLGAKKRGISPEAMIAEIHLEHEQDFRDFGIDFNLYGSTHCEENRVLSEKLYLAAKAKGIIEERNIDQLYCPSCTMFLPDRFIRGTCPSCKAEDQYGDGCEKCSTLYDPTDLIDPKCAECGTVPVLKSSTHHFFKLSLLTEQLKTWIFDEHHVRPEIQNKLKEWFTKGLKDWDISRDAPYFGFTIPGTTDKYFYVWLDAPVGYLATTLQWCQAHGHNFEAIWDAEKSNHEIHHFIGKDILYFHTLFWPAMAMVGGYTLPTQVHIHGFLTINGEKMSKSRGTFIKARDYLNLLPPDYLRYYYAAKLSADISDIDLNLEDFVYRINSDVVGKFVNIASRLGSVVNKKCEGTLSVSHPSGAALLDTIRNAADAIATNFETLAYSQAIRDIMHLADQANKFINDSAPWDVAKTDTEAARMICTTGLAALKLLSIYLKPVLPTIVHGVEQFLNLPPLSWKDLDIPLENQAIQPYEHLAKRVEIETLNQLIS
ncbi:MAG: methionine--tRNA ligase [Candidatus Margulisiibacteriota bacterium]